MKEWLIKLAEIAIVVIDAIALLVIIAGTLGAFAALVKTVVSRRMRTHGPVIWLRYARWLIAGLTFQLAADIIESSIATSWDAVGRLAAIAVIRTFLNYFLERDRDEMRERQDERSKPPSERQRRLDPADVQP